MRCPIDVETDLQMTDRQGIEIDYCPKCRGVWLDRGELDKIIERSASPEQPRYESQPRGREDHYSDRERNYSSDRERHYSKDYRKKRGGFLGDLFDFD
jgi:Zn-finger nucleic acid-binding protein